MIFKELTEEKKLGLVKDLKKFTDKFKGLDIHLQFGSLLGAVREQKLIDGDNDIDVCYLSTYRDVNHVIDEAKFIYNMLKDENMLIKYWDINYEVGSLDEIVDPFGQAHVKCGDLIIDLFTSWIDKNGDYWTCQWGNFGNYEQFFPFKKGELNGIEFNIPNNSEIILKRLYGDWKTPRNDHPINYLKRTTYLKELSGR